MNIDDDSMETRLAGFRTAARAAGYKLTHQRLEIFRVLASSAEHPDVETIYRGVRARLPMISLDTVYRTLATLEELGLIGSLGVRRGGTRFDANLERHHHYVCRRCGMTRDFTSSDFDRLRVPEAVLALGSVEAAQVEIRGVCARCAEAEVATNQKQAALAGGSAYRKYEKEDPK